MPVTDKPDFTVTVPSPVWPPSESGGITPYGVPTVGPGDKIRAAHINSLRETTFLLWNHVHEYSDSIGAC